MNLLQNHFTIHSHVDVKEIVSAKVLPSNLLPSHSVMPGRSIPVTHTHIHHIFLWLLLLCVAAASRECVCVSLLETSIDSQMEPGVEEEEDQQQQEKKRQEPTLGSLSRVFFSPSLSFPSFLLLFVPLCSWCALVLLLLSLTFNPCFLPVMMSAGAALHFRPSGSFLSASLHFYWICYDSLYL